MSAAIVELKTSAGAGADTFAEGQLLTGTHGSDVALNVRANGAPTGTFKTYLRFDLSTLTGYDLDNATDVKLALVTSTGAPNTPVKNFQVYGLVEGLPADAAGGWAEGTLNYLNAPGNVSSATSGGFITDPLAPDENGNYLTLLGTKSMAITAAGTTLEFSDNRLRDFIRNDANGLVTLAVTRTDTGAVTSFWSKEKANGLEPKLIIDAPTVVPEPENVALASGVGLLLAGMALRSVRRR